MKRKPHDPVQSPSYYTDGRYETIEAIEAWRLDHHAGDALAYISRAGKKSPETYCLDLQKALWYIDRILAEPRLREIDPRDFTEDKQLTPMLAAAVVHLQAASAADQAGDRTRARAEWELVREALQRALAEKQ